MPSLELIATLGPALESEALLGRVAEIACRFRLNAAHLSREALVGWLHRVAGLPGGPRPVVVDLQGAKLRLGQFAARPSLGGEVVLVCAHRSSDGLALPVPHPELFATLAPGEHLWLDDARIELELVEQGSGWARARVLKDGPLRSFKGINHRADPGVPAELSPRDAELVAALSPFGFVQLALSFVYDGSEAALLRHSSPLRLVAKIERPEALEHLAAIDSAFDELWFCRGDLGSQCGLARLPLLQRRFCEALPTLRSPAYLAGQVLEHLTHHPEPTRAEVVQLYEASRSGFAGIVLSDETAVGRHVDALIAFLRDWPYLRLPAR